MSLKGRYIVGQVGRWVYGWFFFFLGLSVLGKGDYGCVCVFLCSQGVFFFSLSFSSRDGWDEVDR